MLVGMLSRDSFFPCTARPSFIMSSTSVHRVYRVTTNDKESYNEWQRMVQQVTTSVQRVTTKDKESPSRLIFLFFDKRGT